MFDDHARYCASVPGRFLSVDKLGGRPRDPQTWNRYAYARNNPVKLLDPNGQDFTVAFTFTSDTNLSLKQQIAVARNFGVAYAQAGVKNVTVTLNGATVFKTPFDERAHILGQDVKGTIRAKGSDSQLDAQGRYGHAPDVSLKNAPA
ncbi:MAG: RHS repeat-associated core domain-containing protein, partial [Candidatus Methylomirabilis sp.]